MEKIVIENVRIGESEGGMACGPVGGHLVVEIQSRRADGRAWYSGLVEIEGIPVFFASPESIFDAEIAEDPGEDARFPQDTEIADYDEFFGAYDELAEEDGAHALLMKYAVCLARLGEEETEELKRESIGKTLGSFRLPVCDIEEEYLEECGEEEE